MVGVKVEGEAIDNIHNISFSFDNLNSQARKNVELDSLHLGPTLEGIFAHVSPISTLLYSTKGNIRAQHCPRINSHLSRLQLLGYAMRTVNIIREDSSTQPVSRIIGPSNDLRLSGEFGNALV